MSEREEAHVVTRVHGTPRQERKEEVAPPKKRVQHDKSTGASAPTTLSLMANMTDEACSAALPTMGKMMTLMKGKGRPQLVAAPCHAQCISSCQKLLSNSRVEAPRSTSHGQAA